MVKLYEIKKEYIEALNHISSIENITDEEIKDSLGAIVGELEDKALSVAAYIKNLDAESKSVGEAIKSMSTRKTALDNKIKRMKEYLVSNMLTADIKKLSNSELTVRINKGREGVYVIDEKLLPDAAFKITMAVSKTQIKALLEIGECKGAEIQTGLESVTIK